MFDSLMVMGLIFIQTLVTLWRSGATSWSANQSTLCTLYAVISFFAWEESGRGFSIWIVFVIFIQSKQICRGQRFLKLIFVLCGNVISWFVQVWFSLQTFSNRDSLVTKYPNSPLVTCFPIPTLSLLHLKPHLQWASSACVAIHSTAIAGM